MNKVVKTRASRLAYVSPNQYVIEGFESPFDRKLSSENRWVKLAKLIPWDDIVSQYNGNPNIKKQKGASQINPRVVIGALIIKHICNLTDRETVLQIQENMYMQYFIGLSSFCEDPPFDPSLFVEFRKRLDQERIDIICEKIYKHAETLSTPTQSKSKEIEGDHDDTNKVEQTRVENKGRLLMDATVCPQDITYPTDVKLLNESREMTERLIDKVHKLSVEKQTKPRTYREVARKRFLGIAQSKKPSKLKIRKAIRQQLSYLKRNIKTLHTQLDEVGLEVLTAKEIKYLMVVQTVYDQQHQMYTTKSHKVDHRIVSIHQPHIRPIVRGKMNAKVEFGAKIQVSMIDGFTFLDYLGWEAYNESKYLTETVEKYKKRTGYYPQEVCADQIYCTRENRTYLKTLNIKLKGKPLGRPTAVKVHVSPGERNPIEGKFGQAKTGYGMNRIKARLSQTSSTWIALTIMVLNLVKLAGLNHLCLLLNIFSKELQNIKNITRHLGLCYKRLNLTIS